MRTILPGCMLPDGADPCLGFQQMETQKDAEIKRLKEQIAYMGEVIGQRNAECSRQFNEIERLREELDDWDLIRCDVCDGHFETVGVVGDHLQCDRCSENERLQAALLEIAHSDCVNEQDIAREALKP